ncbi:MAG: CAP domain-containing protein [Anaerolineae bacterium]|nr:MAG: CAP domain-containing protein [Anaerolineae bacterium]
MRLVLCVAAGLAALAIGGWILPQGVLSEPGLDVPGEPAEIESTGSYTALLPFVTRPLLVPPPEEGLGAVNYFRALAGLPPALENQAYSRGAWYHARYMVKNDYLGHHEDRANAWYTSEGAQAGVNSNLMVSGDVNATDLRAVRVWVQAPFHLVGIIDPALREVGFGSYREAIGVWRMGAALDVLRGLGSVPSTVSFPVYYPRDNAYMPVLEHSTESPSPLTSCPGYSAPSGPPIVLQIGDGRETPHVTATSLRRDGTEIAHCIFDETSYTNPDAALQALGRSILDARDAIVVMPRDRLASGSVYTVSIAVNGAVHRWSFTALDLSDVATGGLSLPSAFDSPPGPR